MAEGSKRFLAGFWVAPPPPSGGAMRYKKATRAGGVPPSPLPLRPGGPVGIVKKDPATPPPPHSPGCWGWWRTWTSCCRGRTRRPCGRPTPPS